MEYFCQYCHDWLEVAYCESHFDIAHNQHGITFENLKIRMAVLGGLNTREAPKAEPSTAVNAGLIGGVAVEPTVEIPRPRKNWMFRDKNDTGDVFVTNNFQHDLKS